MPNVVLIPCWKRDDFLGSTADYLLEADKSEDQLYVFLLERYFVAGVYSVANNFKRDKILHRTATHPYKGNTFNVLEGYKLGLSLAKQHNSKLIYLIEEDIFVGKDFFTFHESVQEKFDSFAVSAVRNQNIKYPKPEEPDKVYYHNQYQSLGVSWKPEKLAMVMEHAKPDYYKNRKLYLTKHFPKSRYGDGWDEQDGLINRIMEMHDLKVLYPYAPRAYHAGFQGYNRPGMSLRGPLDERIAKLKAMSDEEANSLAHEHKDIKRCNLEGYGPQQFELA